VATRGVDIDDIAEIRAGQITADIDAGVPDSEQVRDKKHSALPLISYLYLDDYYHRQRERNHHCARLGGNTE